MSNDGSITRWFDSLQAGNREAAQALWLRFANRLIGLARARLRAAPRRAADEEDAVLSAFDSFCRGAEQGRFPQVQDRRDLWNLLVAITVRKVSDQEILDAKAQVGAGGILRRGGDASQQAADAHHLVVHLDAGRLLVSSGEVVLEVGVIGRNERALMHHREAFRCGPRDRRTKQRTRGAVRGKLKDITTRLTETTGHSHASLVLVEASIAEAPGIHQPAAAEIERRRSCRPRIA